MSPDRPVDHTYMLSCPLQDAGYPDVWLQLLKCCVTHADCQPTAICNLAQQLAEQRASSREQQQHVALLRQHQDEQEQQTAQLRDLKQQVALLQVQQVQQVLAHQQVEAERSSRIAVLESMLQSQQRLLQELLQRHSVS